MMDDEKCVICDLSLSNYLETKVVKTRGLQALIDASIKRTDGKSALFANKTEIEIHKICQVSYTSEREIERYLQSQDMANFCVICEQLLCDAESATIGQKGLRTIISASMQRDDGKVAAFQNRTELKLHEICRKNYTCDKAIKSAIKRKLQDQSNESEVLQKHPVTTSASCVAPVATIKEESINTDPNIPSMATSEEIDTGDPNIPSMATSEELDTGTYCIICEEPLSNGRPHSLIKQRAINTFIKHSRQLQDGKAAVLEKKSQIEIHESCKKAYSHQGKVERFVNRKAKAAELGPINELEWRFPNIYPTVDKPTVVTEKKSTGKKQLIKKTRFYETLCVRDDPYENCLACGKDASEDFVTKQKKKVQSTRIQVTFITEKNSENIKRKCRKYATKEHLVLLARMENEDLVSNKARLHDKCHHRVLNNQLSSKPCAGRPGRPQKTPIRLLNMQHIYRYMESDPEKYQFTAEELLHTFRHYELPSKRLIKYHLKQKYGKELVFTPHYCYFKKHSLGSLLESWYKVREENERLG